MTTGDVVYSLRFSLIKILPEPGFDLGSTAGESCVLTARLHTKSIPLIDPISDLFQTNDNYHSYSTRNSQALRTPIGKSKAIYQTFTYIGSLAWNYISSNNSNRCVLYMF